MTEYKKLTDEELIRRLRMGETGIIDYLMEKYKNLVRKEANAMYLRRDRRPDPGRNDRSFQSCSGL